MYVDEIRERFGPWFVIFNTEKSVIYERNTDLFLRLLLQVNGGFTILS